MKKEIVTYLFSGLHVCKGLTSFVKGGEELELI